MLHLIFKQTLVIGTYVFAKANTYHIVAGKTLVNLVDPEQFAKNFTHLSLCHKTGGRLKIHHNKWIPSKELKLVEEHTWPRVSPGHLTTWTPFNHHYSLCTTWHSFLSKKVMLHHWEHSKHLYTHGTYPLTTLDTAKCTHHFITTHDDKINNWVFKFSMACFNQRRQGLFTLQLAKAFPAKFLKSPIRQSFLPQPFCTIWYICLWDNNLILNVQVYGKLYSFNP